MTIIKSAALLSLLLVAGCGSDKLACDPHLSPAAYANREKPPPGFNAPDFIAPPCGPGDKKVADKDTTPSGTSVAAKPDNSAAVAGR